MDYESTQPLVSVIIPVYNVEKYLARCLDSVVGQTYQNLEIILVNDGSTDRSGEICQQYMKNDSRIRLFTQENQGLSAARNTGLDHMAGEYIAFVDSDDYISPKFVEILLRELLRSNVLISRCRYVRVADQEDNRELGAQIDDISSKIMDRMEVFDRFWINESYSCICLYHKTIFKNLRFQVGKYYEDVLLFPNIFWKIDRICFVDIDLYAYRQRSGSITKSGVRKDYLDACLIRLAFAQEHDLRKFYVEIIRDLADGLCRVDDITVPELKRYQKSAEDEVYRLTGKRLFSWRYLCFRAAPRSFRLARKYYLKVKYCLKGR